MLSNYARLQRLMYVALPTAAAALLFLLLPLL
jgi:hypothetical protein